MKRFRNRYYPIFLALILLLCAACQPTSSPSSNLGTVQKADSTTQITPTETHAPVIIYLTQHGETLANTTSRLAGGQSDTPLTQNGKQSAFYLGVGLSAIPFSAAYYSGLHCSYETTHIILGQNHTAARLLPILPRNELREFDFGGLDGMTYSEAAEQGLVITAGESIEEFADVFTNNDPTHSAESYNTFCERVFTDFEALCKEQAALGGGNVLVVAHGTTNRLITDQIQQSGGFFPELENGSIIQIQYENSTFQILEYGDMSYINQAKAAMKTPTPVKVYLVPSGETNAGAAGKIDNVFDNGVTKAALKEAREIGSKMGTLTAVYSGDQTKDTTTANAIISGNYNPNLAVYPMPELRSISLGKYEGGNRADLPNQGAELGTIEQKIKAYEQQNEAAETYEQAIGRILPAVTRIAEQTYQTGGGTIVIVTSQLTQELISAALAPSDGVNNGERILLYNGEYFSIY